MSKDTKNSVPKRQPDGSKIEVLNPNYEGATFEMVVKAMLQRPRKEKKAKGDGPETD